MAYQYDVLPSAEHEYARYLVLEPGIGNTPLVGKIISSALNDFPPYQAVSYVWGAPAKIEKLQCSGGGEIPITDSLSAVLRRIRHKSEKLILWVDQLCINQNDVAERGVQVSLMGDIFENAESTLICLAGWGISTGITDEIATLIKDVNLYIDEELAKYGGDWYELPQAGPEDPYYDDHRWPAYRALMQSRWFVRVWCVQEAGLSRNPRVLFGEAEFQWNSIFRVSAYLRDAGFPIANKYAIGGHSTHLGRSWLWGDKQAGSSWNLSTRMTLSKEDGIPGSEWHLLELLHDSRSLYVTDERDYIYAFLGQRLLARIMSAPDYSAEPEDIYRQFAEGWLHETGDLNLLAYVQRGHRRPRKVENKSKLRTWMPNWAHYGASVISQFRDRDWRAGGHGVDDQYFKIHDQAGFLEVPASIIDSIAFCSPVFTIHDFSLIAYNRDDSVLDRMSAAWPESLREVFSSEGTCAYTNRSIAFAATMTAGGVGDDDYGVALAAAYFSQHYGLSNHSNGPIPEEIAHGKAAYETNSAPALWFESRASMPSIGRRFVVTKSGYYGLAPAMADIGDQCCVIQGARAAYIIRAVPLVDGNFELIGEAYVHDAMMGEFVEVDAVQRNKIVLV